MKSRRRQLDQFYTKPDVAVQCVDHTLAFLQDQGWRNVHFFEPSAGTGSFLNALEQRRRTRYTAMDIEPADPMARVQQADFLTFDAKAFRNSLATSGPVRIIAIGNPPFGKNASLAQAFFLRCTQFADAIAFILPRTFQKVSMQNRLPLDWHCVEEVPIPAESFFYGDEKFAVPCVFQIWARGDAPRQRVKTHATHADFAFVEDLAHADFAFQRVGVRAGTIKPKTASVAPASHYFIKARAPGVRKLLAGIDWNKVKHRTAGNPSISKHELIEAYIEAKDKT